MRDELVAKLAERRNTDVSVEVGRMTHEVEDVEYDSTLDRIVMKAGGSYLRDVVDDMVTLVSELDRGLQLHDIGHAVWYEDWRARVESAIGLEAGELNTATR